ncbi:MAG: ABC transporter substrate-binding protein [Candidatus Adiutrix sp.]|jgi:NitT/TauT family transport system substrate-binding protein|nr:ABC transporter substrate-binding protein [Candidatus Adiutrix sp.]
MKRILAVITTLLLAVGLFTGVTGASEEPKVTSPPKGVPEKTAFNLGHLNSTAHLLAFVAAEEGYFKEEGLAVTLSQFASAGELVAGLEGGQLDAAFIGSVPTITNQAAGHDITIFGGAMTNGHGYVIKSDLVPDGFVEGDISILRGKNIASVKNSVQDYELLVLLKNNGIEIGEGADKAGVVYFESQKDAYNALAGQEIDAASVYSPYASVARAAGHTVVYYCNEKEEFKDQPCCRQVALTGALAASPNTYTAFERALIKAYKFSQENRSKTIDDVARYITIEKPQIEYEVYGGHAASVPDPDKHGTVSLKEGVVEFGYTNGTDYDLEKLYNTGIYETALAQLLAENPDDGVYNDLKAHFDTAN